MNPFWQKLREGLDRLSTRQKVRIVLAVVTTVAVVWGLSLYATRVRYGVLFSHLDRDDAASVVTLLRERQTPYRLSAGGTLIEVPAGEVDELRLAMAGEGLPAGGGVGFEIFDKPAFGLSDFVQNVNYRRALERELGRTILSLEAVEAARVHLALPPESVFADEHREPTASVVVRLRSGGSLPQARVRAIANLVASGVEGLQAQNVSVIDGEGRLLSEPADDEDAGLNATQLEAKRTMERSIESTLVSILEPVVGPGRVQARATVELNLKRVQRTEETYDPNVAVVRSEEKSKTRQGSAGPGGIPGTASNLPGGSTAAGDSASSGESARSITNFELNKTISTVAEPSGAMSRQSVAVVVDHAVVEQTDADGKTEAVATPRTPEEMQKITDLVRAAIGVDTTRGDQLIVENIPFDAKAHPLLEPPGRFGLDFWLKLSRYASLPLAVLLLALLVIRPGIAALRGLDRVQVQPLALESAPTIAALQARLRAELESGALPALIRGTSPLRQRLIEAAVADPRTAALVVKDWIDDGKDKD